jgi:hypothetical protein
MTREVQAADRSEPDLIDRIANALPEEVRADYYREMRHCRSLPENDEMLRILRAMQFLTLLMQQVPNRIATERENLDGGLREAADAIRQSQESTEAYHRLLDDRLVQLPTTIANGISPDAIAGKVSENLRQQFVQSTIPQTAEALAVIARDMKNTTAEFGRVASELSGSYGSAAQQASVPVQNIEDAVSRAMDAAKRAADNLSWTFSEAYRWSLHSFCALALVLGMILGMMAERWLGSPKSTSDASVPSTPAPAANVAPKLKR